MREPAVRAVDFESRKVYQSSQHPGYTSWVSFFPGERGQWYLTCEEVTRPDTPIERMPLQKWYEMSLPVGYDKSAYLMEAVILESNDDMKTWEVISREPAYFNHSAGSFAQARTTDGRFLRFVWSDYAYDPKAQPEKFFQSCDSGKTWEKMPRFHDAHFASYPHRLRTLRDGTMVLAIPFAPKWGPGTDRPVRASKNLNALGEMQMTLYFSHDQGVTWNGPFAIYGGQNVSETDFVELPSGDLLFINNGIFAYPGRQFVYRDGNCFTPGSLEKVKFVEDGAIVPETVCLTEDGVLIGCMRCSRYVWSDDLGQTWWNLNGAPNLEPEMYQPWIQYLGDGRVACAGHYGHDDPISDSDYDQYLMIHFFNLEVLRRTKNTKVWIERDYDEASNRYMNSYSLTLTCDGEPLADKELEFTYFERFAPEKEQTIAARTGDDGVAHVSLRHLDHITDRHNQVYITARFNADRRYPDYKPAETPQVMFYFVSYQDDKIRRE